MKNILIPFLFYCSASFGQSVPNSATFTIGHVMFAVYGDSAVGRNTATVFADSNAAEFDATYGSKTMSPQTINGFRNYHATIPTVTTAAVTSIMLITATSGGNVTSDGGATVTTRGICLSTSPTPTVANTLFSSGSGTGFFVSNLTGLSEGTTYYIRAYAYNSIGTAYGSELSFTTESSPSYSLGYLYNHLALANLASAGWHVPTQAEITTLWTYLGGFSIAGGKLKSTGTSQWLTPNTGATNETGFSGVPSGGRIGSPSFDFTELGHQCIYWTVGDYYPYAWGLVYNTAEIGISNTFNNYDGMSVRLIKDNSTDTGTYTGNDGKTYPTVKIGSQVWTSVNLSETYLNDANPIPLRQSLSDWTSDYSAARCVYP